MHKEHLMGPSMSVYPVFHTEVGNLHDWGLLLCNSVTGVPIVETHCCAAMASYNISTMTLGVTITSDHISASMTYAVA
jgi:hypothetical protein